MRDRIEDLAVRHLSIFVLVVIRDTEQPIFRGYPIPLPGRAVTDGTINRELFLAALK